MLEKMRVKHEKCLPKFFTKSRFTKLSPRKILEDEVRLIDKTQASDPSKREFYWMRTFRTFYSDGLNIKGNAQFLFLCNPQKSGASQVCITFLQVTQKILTKDTFL